MIIIVISWKNYKNNRLAIVVVCCTILILCFCRHVSFQNVFLTSIRSCWLICLINFSFWVHFSRMVKVPGIQSLFSSWKWNALKYCMLQIFCPLPLLWILPIQFSSVQSLSRVRLFATPWTAARQASLSITNSQSSLTLMSIESVMPSSHLILCRPLLLQPPIPLSIRVFSNESTLRMRWPKYWSFSFSISPSKEHPGLISFTMDWLDLLAVQGTLKSLLQHHSSKSSILQHSAFFTVQLSHAYVTTGKTIALTRRTFVGKVMSLLLNMLSRLVITFLPRSKRLLISWLQSPSAVILEPQKIKSDTVSIFFPIYFPWSDGTGCHDLCFLNVEL